ncbi:MAG: thiamine phosphate synthase, partial [Clostridiales bacterium]|nr:thiamine phosphate synthase [Clostridiales bacterium]
MKCEATMMRLYAVTDRTWLHGRELTEAVKEAIAGGITCLQLREKDLSPAAFLEEALELKRVTTAAGIPLIINDSVD